VTLNAQLVCVPVHCIDYVILHELCHLVHHDHSKAFRGLLMRLQPDWAARKAVLEGFRPG
jgi:predicted metal-dependent hydrolase